MIMLLYDMIFWITSFDMIEPSPCILLFPMYFLVLTQKPKAKFQTLQWYPYFHYWRRKDTTVSHFLLWKGCSRLKLNLWTCYYFSLKRGFCLNWLILLVCSFYTRRLDDLFILPTNTINQIASYMYY